MENTKEITPLESLENWINKSMEVNGTPTISEILAQIDLHKDLEKEYFDKKKRQLLTSYEDYTSEAVLGKSNARNTKTFVDGYLENNSEE